MKKLFFLTLISGAILSTDVQAQAGDPPSVLEQMKASVKPHMMEKTGLTEAQVDRIVEINYEMRESMRAYANLNETERAAKIAEMKAARDKKYSEIPLTAEQIASVKAFYESLAKNPPPKRDK